MALISDDSGKAARPLGQNLTPLLRLPFSAMADNGLLILQSAEVGNSLLRLSTCVSIRILVFEERER